MAVTVYTSSDTDAPVLNMTPHSYINVLKACLQDGYGSGGSAKAGAGWIVAANDQTAHKAIFQNNASGSNKYWLVKNDGQINTTQTVGSFPYACAIKGCASFSNVNSTSGDFPRCVTGSDLHFSNDYGVFVMFSAITNDVFNSPTPVVTDVNLTLPWKIIADEKTAWLFTFPFNNFSDAAEAFSSTQITMIGDVSTLGSNSSLPKAATIGNRVKNYPHLGGS